MEEQGTDYRGRRLSADDAETKLSRALNEQFVTLGKLEQVRAEELSGAIRQLIEAVIAEKLSELQRK